MPEEENDNTIVEEEQEETTNLKWWENKVDEMFIALCITIICCVAFWADADVPPSAFTVGATAVGGLCVYVSGKVKANGSNN